MASRVVSDMQMHRPIHRPFAAFGAFVARSVFSTIFGKVGRIRLRKKFYYS